MIAGTLIGIGMLLLLILVCWLIVAVIVDAVTSRTAGKYTLDHREIERRES